jgi:hypothetical protein
MMMQDANATSCQMQSFTATYSQKNTSSPSFHKTLESEIVSCHDSVQSLLPGCLHLECKYEIPQLSWYLHWFESSGSLMEWTVSCLCRMVEAGACVAFEESFFCKSKSFSYVAILIALHSSISANLNVICSVA